MRFRKERWSNCFSSGRNHWVDLIARSIPIRNPSWTVKSKLLVFFFYIININLEEFQRKLRKIISKRKFQGKLTRFPVGRLGLCKRTRYRRRRRPAPRHAQVCQMPLLRSPWVSRSRHRVNFLANPKNEEDTRRGGVRNRAHIEKNSKSSSSAMI